MERVRPYLKVAAVVSAVALVGTFVAYRAGAFAPPVPVESHSEPSPTGPPQTAAEQPTPISDPQHPAIMFGSKSAPAFLPGETVSAPAANPAPITPLTEPDKVDKSPTFIGGSKSIILVPAGPLPGLTPPNSPNTPPPAPPGTPKP